MANRAFKLQEFVAHSRSVRCLSIGKKAHRLLLTGGEDHRVNVWRIGKSYSLTSLSGHSSSVECVAFDSAEILVLAGASSGAVKLWDLEESKLLRNFTGHRSKCTAIDFHPFGELFASSSVGKNLKIWDIRKKGSIQMYKAHSLGINTIKFTPDGRWVVSGGLDNVVKVWDLTAGKLLRELNFHDGPIRSIDFHPSEFLLATGSADRTVKFWDLETFEMIGSTRVEAAEVRAMSFHPDGRTLFCGYDENFKVHSWEPVVCHDSIDMEWSTLGDLCIHEQRVIGCSYYRNSVGIWAADLSLIKPYGTSSTLEDNGPMELKPDIQETDSLSPDEDMKEIKVIYVDYEKPINPKNSKVRIPVDRKELNKLPSKKSSSAVTSKSFVTPSTVTRESSDVKDFDSLRASTRVPVTSFQTRTASDTTLKQDLPETVEESPGWKKPTKKVTNGVAAAHGRTRSLVEKFERWDKAISREDKPIESNISSEVLLHNEEPQISGRDLSSPSDENIIEDLMQSHDIVLSDLRYRLTKLQMLRSFWERNDFKGAINTMKKFPDHSVQADVISVFMDKMDIINLDLFSCLLPVLLTLLDSQRERHAKMSLEMLLKLVAVFGEMISSTISATPSIGVDLHQEERIKCCRDCFNQLQKLQRTLPEITRRSALLAKLGLELNLILQLHNII